MSGAVMKASVVLTLDDQLTNPLDNVFEAFDRLTSAIEKCVGQFDRLNFESQGTKAEEASRKIGMFERNLQALGETAGGVGRRLDHMWSSATEAADKMGGIGAALAGFSVVAPVDEFAKYENILQHIAITQKLSGDQVPTEVKRLTEMFAADAQKTGQSSESIAKAYFELITTGIPAAILDRVIGAHSEAATAYNISPEALGSMVGALISNMKIPAEENAFRGVLSAVALASKEGRFKVEDFSRLFPAVSGELNALQMTGRQNTDYALAASEIIMKNAGEPNQAAAWLTDMLNYMVREQEEHRFKKTTGIDIDKLLIAAQKRGENPVEVYLDQFEKLIAGKGGVEAGHIITSLVGNQQAAAGIMALIQHRPEFRNLNAALDKVDPGTTERDFESAHDAPITEVRLFHEDIDQLTRTFGEGFAPALGIVDRGLLDMNEALKSLNTEFPVLMPILEATLGVIIALGAAIGVISWLFGGVAAIVAAAVAVIAIGAVEIYEHWDAIKQFFIDLWDGVGDRFIAFGTWLEGWLAGEWTSAVARVTSAWSSVERFFADLWRSMSGYFDSFLTWLEGWIAGAWTATVARVTGAWNGVERFFTDLWRAMPRGFTDFTTWLDGWIGGAMTAAIGAIEGAWAGLGDFFTQLWADIRAPFDAFASSVESLLSSLPGLGPHPALAGVPGASGAPGAPGADGTPHNAHGFSRTVPVAPAAPVTAKVDLSVSFDSQNRPVVTDKATGKTYHSGDTLPDGRTIGRD